MGSSMAQADGIFARCPVCVYNMAISICGMTCAQNQSLFMEAHNDTYENQQFVAEVDFRIDDDSVKAVYDSCAGIQHTQTGRPAMDLACGAYNAKTCDHRKWYNFMGDPSLSDYVPFPINYQYLNESSDEVRLILPAKNCTEALEGSYACSCVDCSASCPYMDPPTGEEKGFMIAGLYGITFIVSLVFGALVMICILCGSLNIFKPKISITTCCTGFDCVNTILSKLFLSWGHFCAKHPVLVLAICSWIIGGLAYGVIYLSVTTNPIDLWAGKESQTRQEKKYFDEHFGPFYRTNQIFAKPLNQTTVSCGYKTTKPLIKMYLLQFTHNTSAGILTFGPAFEKNFLKEVFLLQEQIQSLTTENGVTLADVCYAPMVYVGETVTIDNCLVQSIYGYYQNDMDGFDREYEDSNGYTNTYLNQLEDCLR